MTGLSDRLSGVGFATGWRLVRMLPGRVADTAFSLGADMAAARGGSGITQLRRNLARVVPQAGPEELDELTRRALRSYARYWQESFRLPAMDLDEMYQRVDPRV
ncbi:MAG: phosphatidylinositol mannoside acyltransferase, partial [Haloechinothrix sp.]